MIRIESRRGSIGTMAHVDCAVAGAMVNLYFACVEAAANILINLQLEPVGKTPEFKFAAGRVSVSEPEQVAADKNLLSKG